MKKTILLVGCILLALAIYAGCNKNTEPNQEQRVYETTLNITKIYLGLRYETDKALFQAKEYTYTDRNTTITNLINARENLATDVQTLEQDANTLSKEISFSLFPKAAAYDRNELSNIFDKAPAGKKIATLAKHLGVDAKTAFKILKNDQAQVEADAWNEAGDTFQKLETSATVIKDGCKVAGYVGSIAVGGGVAALASKSLLTQAAVVVGGADLVLEVTDDSAKIALGNHNKISSIVSDVRIVTEPIASILTITDIPNNIDSGFEKFSAAMVALDAFRGTAQEGKVLGIELPAYTKTEKFANIKKYTSPVYVSVIQQEEIETWLAENQKTTVQEQENADEEMRKEIVKATTKYIKNSSTKNTEKSSKQATTNDPNSIIGTREGNISRTPSSSTAPEAIQRAATFHKDGTVDSSIFESRDYEDDERENDVIPTWTKEGNIVRIYNADFGNDNNYFEFNLQGNTLIFIKLVGPDSEGERGEWLAGSDFFGGKFFEGSLQKSQ